MRLTARYKKYREQILEILTQSKTKSLDEPALVQTLGLQGAARKRLRLLLREMAVAGELTRLTDNSYSLGSKTALITGIIEVLRSGDAVVKTEDRTQDIFISRDDRTSALPGDKVSVLLSTQSAGRSAGKVLNILERSQRTIVATLRSFGRSVVALPVNPVYGQHFKVADLKTARANDRVVLRIKQWGHRPLAEIVEIIGPADKPSLDTLTVIKQFDLPEDFPVKVTQAAEQINLSEADFTGRHDARDLFIFTMDPVTARDFDDALSLQTDEAGQRKLGVHIADVSYFVKPGSVLDREARQRGNSVYFPDKVLPMLPEQLSNGWCSLRPNADRLALSVWLTFDKAGQWKRTDFTKSIIRSRLRLSYEEGLQILKGGCPEVCQAAAIGNAELETIRQIHGLAQQLRQQRFKRDYALELDVPEYEVILGAKDTITAIQKRKHDISHQLIEECMLAANEAVDRELLSHGKKILHRVHLPPDPGKIEQLYARLLEMGLRPGDLSIRPNLAAFLKSLQDNPFEHSAKIAVLKSMQRASYAPEALGHYGLAKKYYTHFTSPIRRYPDLITHRVLSGFLKQEESSYTPAELTALGLHCSQTEQAAEQAEKTLLEIKKYRYLEQQTLLKNPPVHEAVIVQIMGFGMFVELTELQVQGLVHLSSLARKTAGSGRYQPKISMDNFEFRHGDKVKVIVKKVDFDNRQIDFELAEKPLKQKTNFKSAGKKTKPVQKKQRRLATKSKGKRGRRL